MEARGEENIDAKRFVAVAFTIIVFVAKKFVAVADTKLEEVPFNVVTVKVEVVPTVKFSM